MSGISINKLVCLLQLLYFSKLKNLYAFVPDYDIANGEGPRCAGSSRSKCLSRARSRGSNRSRRLKEKTYHGDTELTKPEYPFFKRMCTMVYPVRILFAV